MLISGTALAQLIPILIQPILRRYYSPEIFGAYSVYISLVGILSIVSSLKYELAIVLPRNDRMAINLFFLTLLVNLSFSGLLLIVIVIWVDKLLIFFNLSGSMRIYLYFVPVGIFFYSLYQSINYWLIRKKEFFAVSLNKFYRRGAEGLFQLIFKYVKLAHGIILGDIIGHMANTLTGFWQGSKSGLNFSLVSLSKLRYVAGRYSEFPKFNAIPSFMSACSFLMPIIMINKFFSSEYTGYFDLSKLLLSIPLALISSSVSNVLLQRMTDNFRSKISLMKDILMVLSIVLLISVLEILIIQLFGVRLFEFIFGDRWGYSGEISKILVWSYTLNFIVASFSAAFISLNKIKLLSIWQVIYFISIMSLILFREHIFIDFIKVYVFIEILCYMIYIIVLARIIYIYERSLINRQDL